MSKLLSLADVRDYLKTLNNTVPENYFIGKLDNKKEKSIGVYQLKTDTPNICLGGLENTPYDKKSISILIHWNNNFKETEIASWELYEKLQDIQNIRINDINIYFINLLVNEPVDVGTDDNGVYERVIQAEIYYERKEK